MYAPPSYGGAPPYSMPSVTPGVDRVGLGFWAALIPVGTKIVGGLIDGGGGDLIDSGTYYRDARAGSLLCPGPYNVEQVAAAIGALDSTTPEGLKVRGQIAKQFAKHSEWSGTNTPTTPRAQAGALVNWAHGERSCTQDRDSDRAAASVVDAILAHEAARRKSLMEAARAAAARAAQTARRGAGALETLAAGPPLVAGVSNVTLLGGAALVAVVLLARRR